MKYLVTQWIAGLSLPFGPRVQFWLELLAYLFCTLAVVLLIVEERREHIARRERRLSMASPRGSIWIPPEVRSSAARATKLLGLALLGGILGWLLRDHQFSSPPRIYTDVLITQRYDSKNFEVQPARMPKMQWTTCQDVNWQAAEKAKFIAFQQHSACKDVTVVGWYDFYNDSSTGKRIKFTQEIANAY
jgi:hypothetical protein